MMSFLSFEKPLRSFFCLGKKLLSQIHFFKSYGFYTGVKHTVYTQPNLYIAHWMQTQPECTLYNSVVPCTCLSARLSTTEKGCLLVVTRQAIYRHW